MRCWPQHLHPCSDTGFAFTWYRIWYVPTYWCPPLGSLQRSPFSHLFPRASCLKFVPAWMQRTCIGWGTERSGKCSGKVQGNSVSMVILHYSVYRHACTSCVLGEDRLLAPNLTNKYESEFSRQPGARNEKIIIFSFSNYAFILFLSHRLPFLFLSSPVPFYFLILHFLFPLHSKVAASLTEWSRPINKGA